MSNKKIFRPGAVIWDADQCDPLKIASENKLVKCLAISHGDYPGQILDDEILPELVSLGYWDCTSDQSWGLDWHRNEGIEITFLANGKLNYSTAYKNHELNSGHVTAMAPWERHKVGNPHIHASCLYWLILDVKVSRPHDQWIWPDWILLSHSELNTLENYIRSSPVYHANERLKKAFMDMDIILNRTSPEKYITHLKLYINDLLLALLEALYGQEKEAINESSVENTIQTFINDLPLHIDSTWTLDNMASECGLGRTRFAHYFKVITNTTPIDYLNDLRLKKAVQDLENTQIPVKEIALQCGFGSSDYLSRQFKKKYKCSPKVWRQNSTS